jgi:nitrate reductase molybdenum cofactor assembly chaperone NarJ/NarW
MTNETRLLLRLLSLCLAYPDAAALSEMEAATAELGDPDARERLSRLMTLMKAQPLLQLQEHYTAVFDMNPSASLNLTWHLMGDREERGRALADLLAVYLQAGFEPAVSELPDFLPLMLEFMAAAPPDEPHGLIRQCLAAVPVIAGRLQEAGSLYAVPLELLCGVFPAAASIPLSPVGDSPAGASGA